ncbi:hypothetical protein C8R44DRAFT_987275 [Mycena epipterygia]|nr:hypothetical protein C8R44DRAFT_987275 [Mycena epipterygia]
MPANKSPTDACLDFNMVPRQTYPRVLQSRAVTPEYGQFSRVTGLTLEFSGALWRMSFYSRYYGKNQVLLMHYWLLPLLTDPRVNDAETLVLLTFDENESYGIQNGVWSLGLGGAIPLALRGTTDDTLYTHYSALSTVQANWGLGSLGRQDANASISNVFDFVAKKSKSGCNNRNVHLPAGQVPHFNLTGVANGALTSVLFTPFAAPNTQSVGAGRARLPSSRPQHLFDHGEAAGAG